MRLIVTKTYKVEMADAEKENFHNIAEKLEQIEDLFVGKQVFYKGENDCDYEMTSAQIREMIEFLRALVYDDVEVIN